MNYNYDVEKIKNLDEILSLMNNDASLYVVGGFLRDKILGHESFDIDFIVQNQNAIELAHNFAKKMNYTFVLLDEVHEIARVVFDDKIHYFDFARCENDDIIHDLKRRDLTINALAYQIFPKLEILDINNSIKDIEQNTIKAVSNKNLIDDPIRLLRVFRFASKTNFDIDQNLLDFIKEQCTLIKKVAQERINQEFWKFLEGNNCYKYLIQMKDTGLLYEIFEILRREKDIPKNSHHHLCLIDHSIETVKNLELLLHEKKEYTDFLDIPILSGYKRICYLKLSALLHDVGKPETWTIDDTGRHRFIGHDNKGGELLKPLLKKMKYGKNLANYIILLVKSHIYPSQLAKSEDNVSEKAIKRFFRKMGNYTPDVIFLAMADRLSARGEAITNEMVEQNLFVLTNYLSDFIEFSKTEKQLPKLLSGDEIADILNIPKNKNLGIIINALQEAQLSEDVITKTDAINFIKSYKLLL